MQRTTRADSEQRWIIQAHQKRTKERNSSDGKEAKQWEFEKGKVDCGKKITNYQGVCVCVVVLLNGSAVVVRVQHRQCCAVRAATLRVQFHTFTVLLQITTVINGISTRWTGHLSSENNVNTWTIAHRTEKLKKPFVWVQLCLCVVVLWKTTARFTLSSRAFQGH